MLRLFFAFPLIFLLISCAPRPITDSSKISRPSQFQRGKPVNFGQWYVQNCTLQHHTSDFILSTSKVSQNRSLTFVLKSKIPLLEHPQLTFNTSDFLINLEGQNQGNKPKFRFDIPYDATLLPQLYQDGAYLILTYLPRSSSTFQQHFFNTKNALNGLNYLAKNC